MILLSVRMAKLLLFVISIAIIFRGFFKKLSKRGLACVGALMILFALIANFAAGKVPALMDTVTLTALGEKREEAGAEEILLTGYTVDEKSFSAGKTLQIVDGKWFWSGENYLWRIETDPRQPAGTTRSITIKVPVGWERSLDFCSDVWRGKVEIAANGTKQTVDAFSEEYTPLSVPIGRSRTSALILDQARRFAVYAALLCAAAIAAAAWLSFTQRKPEAAAAWLKRNGGKIIYALVAAMGGYLMFYYSGDVSLWSDELLELDLARGSLQAAVWNCLTMRNATPPFYSVCAWAWYHIAPFGERWLLLVSVVPTAAAVYMIGLVGEKLKGKYCGMLSSCLLAFSPTVWNSVAFEFRAYAFVLLFSTLSLYCHLQKNCSNEKNSWLAVYSIALLGLAMSHYFGMLMCGLFFLSDLYLYGTRKISRKSVVSYILPGSVSLVWLYLVFQTTLRHQKLETIASWYPKPTLQNVIGILRFLSGNYPLLFYLFLLGVACALTDVWRSRTCGKDWTKIYQRLLLWMLCAVIVLMYVYGNYINPKSTMWENRYFIILIPLVTLLSSLGLVSMISFDDLNQKFRLDAITILIGAVLFCNCLTMQASWAYTQPFREAADWLYMQSNEIFNPDTVIVQTIIDGPWHEYYICRKGRRDPLCVVGQTTLTEAELLSYSRVYVQYSHVPISEWLQAALDESYTLETDLPDIQMKVYTRK